MRLAGALALVALVLTASAGATSIARVTLPQMERASTVVFVGELTSERHVKIGGYQGRRYGLRVERFLRGGRAETVHLSVVDLPGLSLGLKPEERYLVFAEPRRFGTEREERLTPVGYYQGVYRVLDDARAENDSNGTVELERLRSRLRRETRVRVTLVHEVDSSKSTYIEGAAHIVRLERDGRVIARATGSGSFESRPGIRVQPGWYVVASGAHPCAPDGSCRSVDFQADPGIDTCRKLVRFTGARATIRVTARPGATCRIDVS